MDYSLKTVIPRLKILKDADLIIFNTCAIREKAEHKFYSQLGRAKILKEKNKGLKIAVAGCVAQDAQKKIFQKAPFVDYILGPQNIHLLNDMLLEKSEHCNRRKP